MPRPALRPSIAWLAGAGLGVVWDPVLRTGLLSAVAALGVGALVLCRTRSLARAVLVPLAGASLVFCSLALDAHRERVGRLFGPTRDVLETEIRGVVTRSPERAFDGTRVLELEGVRASDLAMRPARLRLRIASSAAASEVDGLERRDRIRVWCRLARPGPPRQRDSPDPRTRSAARGIVAHGSVKSARLVTLENPGRGVRSRIDRLRRVELVA